ncbi:hypothetical protein A1O1_07389 [Capronia coronata CBS 617.96]|uniref:Major facilitator superfamily (MFS) profile domain-containing protein n=1 Tax=Capronia coronata CBS 617.96 TaxID=1182541 RepID=W9XT76_9EURO|nr:uncharacterized protein A1O1_07389 [Capronia coronata CBS 617.96]EXJ83762.1 hypothetical protein A1O1_07389 [Capronia coronata CBS 617.96]
MATPRSSLVTVALLLWNGLNILPSYTDYFHLNTTTLAVQSAIGWAGLACAGFFFGQVTDWLGRKKAMWISAAITLIGAILQTASQNVAMFVVSRFIVGVGNGCAFLCAPVYLAEVLPLKWRGVGLGLFMACFYVGGLLAAGITYCTAKMQSTWAWRLPSAIQGVLTVISVTVLPFVPETPRWLMYHVRPEEALRAIAATHGDGNHEGALVLATYKEIVDSIAEEKKASKLSAFELLKNKQSVRRLMLCTSVAVITMCSGNNIISFYLGKMLTNAGITNSNTQLEINIILNAWCLVVALVGTFLVDSVGRKPLGIISCVLMTIFIFLVGALTKVYGDSTNNSGIYGTVATIFLFQGSYSLAWTPLAMLYPPEVLNYSVRSVGMGVYTFLTNGFGLMVTMAFPYALDAIGWKTYMINGVWDVLQIGYVVYYWVETKGKTLEEIDELFGGADHLTGPRIQEVLQGIEPHLALDGTDVVVADGKQAIHKTTSKE